MSWALNLIIPGTGLIFLRREWLGMWMAFVFAICCNLALAGRLITPEAVPPWLTLTATLLAVFTWILAQYLHYRQGLVLVRTAEVMAQLLAGVREALAANDLERAKRELTSAVALDDECAEVHVLRAHVSKCAGNDAEARVAWRRVIQLDLQNEWADEARKALAAEQDSTGNGSCATYGP